MNRPRGGSVATAGLCAGATVAAIAASGAWNAYQYRNGDDTGRRVSLWRAPRNFGIDAVGYQIKAVHHVKFRPKHIKRFHPGSIG